jgi:hypothetical protein
MKYKHKNNINTPQMSVYVYKSIFDKKKQQPDFRSCCFLY